MACSRASFLLFTVICHFNGALSSLTRKVQCVPHHYRPPVLRDTGCTHGTTTNVPNTNTRCYRVLISLLLLTPRAPDYSTVSTTMVTTTDADTSFYLFTGMISAISSKTFSHSAFNGSQDLSFVSSITTTVPSLQATRLRNSHSRQTAFSRPCFPCV